MFRRSVSAMVAAAAPEFTAQEVDCTTGIVREVTLHDFKGKFLILLFYPLNFTFVCPTELTAFNDRLGEFEKLNAVVRGVSVDSPNSHLAWTSMDRKKGGLKPFRMPILSDLDKSMAKAYNVLHKNEVALRGTFIIDSNGILRHSTVNDLNVGRNVSETLRVLEAIQFTDMHGEVCPIDWVKGQPGMKPTEAGVAKYFEK